ncbi:PilZ domain-containing protein [Thalassotalea sp. LPB0316]|uniref:PilZ domain-containing protein n=1 Tax=Thalassotalea sp. LPB0316 TaxID=2769490 RepID=UPI00186632E6|nr:PilZ domain-containing protein [Thalassotalea sp. LPB0316]QOL26461.1 PilZ domain-containing protein [Thalassotalea sp. LPB0316]
MSDEEQMSERRRHIRLDMEGEVVLLEWLEGNNGCSEKFVCVDFSRKGIKVSSDKKIALYTPVDVTLMPDTSKQHTLKARVIRCVIDRDDQYSIAMLFQD